MGLSFQLVCDFFPYVKSKVFYDEEFPREKSATTICGVNFQLLAAMLLHELAHLATASCSRPYPAMGHDVREGRSN